MAKNSNLAVNPTAQRVAPGAYAWQACGGGGTLVSLDGKDLPGETPEELGRACIEHLVHIARAVEAYLDVGRPPWLTQERWDAHCELAEDLRLALPVETYLALVHGDEDAGGSEDAA